MEQLRTLARSLCTACLIAGITLHLLEGSSLGKCIKATAGLYILVIVLHTVQNLPITNPSPAAALSGSPMPDISNNTEYTDAVLTQSRSMLEEKIEHDLQQQGIDATVHLELKTGEQGVIVQTAYLTLKNMADRNVVDRYLRQELQAEEILFEEKR